MRDANFVSERLERQEQDSGKFSSGRSAKGKLDLELLVRPRFLDLPEKRTGRSSPNPPAGVLGEMLLRERRSFLMEVTYAS